MGKCLQAKSMFCFSEPSLNILGGKFLSWVDSGQTSKWASGILGVTNNGRRATA